MTKRDRIILAVFGTTALLAGFWFGALKPKQAEVKELDSQVAAQVERRDAAAARVAAGESARRTYKRDYATVARLGKAVPPDEQTPSLVFGLEATADANGVDLRDINLAGDATGAAKGGQPAPAGAPAGAPGQPVGAAAFPSLPLTFTLRGDFFDMERFLAAVERYTTTVASGDAVSVRGRLVTIDSVGLKPGSDDLSSVEATVTATAYMLPKDEGLTDGATPQGPAGADAATTTAGATPPSTGGSSTPAPTTATIRGVK